MKLSAPAPGARQAQSTASRPASGAPARAVAGPEEAPARDPEAMLRRARLLGHSPEGIRISNAPGSAVIQRLADEDIKTGHYYRVRTPQGARVLYLKQRKFKKADSPPEYTFFEEPRGLGIPVVINDENDVLADLGTQAPLQAPVLNLPQLPQEPEIEEEPSFAPFGPYSRDQSFNPFKAAKPQTPLAERLATLPDLLGPGLSQRLDPRLFVHIQQALEEQAAEVPDIEDLPPLLAQQPQPARQQRATRSSRGGLQQPVALTGLAAGVEFVENHVPREIDGTNPLIEPVGEKLVPTATRPPEPDPSKPKQPGYVLNLPSHVSKDVDGILQKYGDQATRGAADAHQRLAAVVAVNTRKPLRGDGGVEAKIEGVTKDQGFDYGLTGFYWAPEFTIRGVNRQFGDVKSDFDGLPDETAKKYAEKNLYAGRSGQDFLPYGLFREQASISDLNRQLILELAKRNDPVYVHIGDPDAINWTVNNNPNEGVLARYDKVIAELGKEAEALSPLIIGGYNLGVPSLEDLPAERLVKLGNIAERALRRVIASIVPETLYPTEPNLLLKAVDSREGNPVAMLELLLTPGALFGKKASEGNELRLRLANLLNRNRSDPRFAPYVDATIETEIPPRILESARSHPVRPVLNVLQQKQSYLTVENWTGISRLGAEARAKAKVEKAIRDYVETRLGSVGHIDEQAEDQRIGRRHAFHDFESWRLDALGILRGATKLDLDDIIDESAFHEAYREGLTPQEFVDHEVSLFPSEQELREVLAPEFVDV